MLLFLGFLLLSLSGALTSIRHVNKTDSLTLCQTFGTLAAVLGAPMEELVRCPGIGDKKVRRLHDTFHEPFRRRVAKLPSKSTINSSNGVTNISNKSTNGIGSGYNNSAPSTVVVSQKGNGQNRDKTTAEERAPGTSNRPAAYSDGVADGVIVEGGQDDDDQDGIMQGGRKPSQTLTLGKALSGENSRGNNNKGLRGLEDCTDTTAQKRRGEGSALGEREEEGEEVEEEEGHADGAPEVTMSQLPDYGGSFMSSQPSTVLLRKRPRGERHRNEEDSTISPSLILIFKSEV